MQVTHVPITRVDRNREDIAVAYIAVFILGLTIGSAFILYQNGALSFPEGNAKDQLGAVGLSDVADRDISLPIVSPPLAADENPSTPRDVTAEANTAEDAQTQNEERARMKADLTLRITDRTIAIDRINQEIERAKNISVALVTAFDQNCGNWTDVCAKPYVDKLDESNANYNDLVEKLRSVTLELDSLKQELGSFSN